MDAAVFGDSLIKQKSPEQTKAEEEAHKQACEAAKENNEEPPLEPNSWQDV